MGKHKTSIHWGIHQFGQRGGENSDIHLSEQGYFISRVTSPPGLNHCPKSLSKLRSPGSGLRND